MPVNFASEVSRHTLQGFLTCSEILRHGADGITSAPKLSRATDFYSP
jgi:hypothetical protein